MSEHQPDPMAEDVDDVADDPAPEASMCAKVVSVSVPPYLRTLVSFLKEREPELWDWFSSERMRIQHAEESRLEILKHTVRVDPASKPRWYELGNAAMQRLGLDLPLTLFLTTGATRIPAAIAMFDDAAHIMLSGALAERLTDEELSAVLAHELGHALMWRLDDGAHRMAGEILDALCQDSGAEPVHFETNRVQQLFTEVFCDRAALSVAGDHTAVISALLKLETDTSEVDVPSYLAQAREILAAPHDGSDGLTHPELYIRARALEVHMQDAEAADVVIDQLVRGGPQLERFDFLRQREVSAQVRSMVLAVVEPLWLRTDSTMAHVLQFFDDPSMTYAAAVEAFGAALPTSGPEDPMRDLWCAILLDGVTADRSLEPASVAYAIRFAESMGIGESFEAFAVRELKLRKTQYREIREQASTLIDQAQAADSAAEEPS